MTIVPRVKMPVFTMDMRIKEYVNKKGGKSNIEPGSLETFKESVFWEFYNNFSTEYIPIENQFKEKVSVPRMRDSTLPMCQLSSVTDSLDAESTLSFNPPEPFAEGVFSEFQSQYCFRQQVGLQDFPSADDFEDYQDEDDE